MNCEKFRSNIAAFLAGELDERSSDEQRKHAEECSKCADEIKSTAVLVDILTALPDRTVPGLTEARVLRSIESMRGKHKQQMLSPVPLLSRIQGVLTLKRSLIAVGLAGLAAVITIFALTGHPVDVKPQTGRQTVPAHEQAVNPKKDAGHSDIRRVNGVPQPDAANPHIDKQAPEVDSTKYLENVVTAQTKIPGKIQRIPERKSPVVDSTPIVVLAVALQPVTDSAGRTLNIGDRVAAGMAIRTGKGGHATLVTQKGSEINLGPNSEINFSTKTTMAILRGRLYCSNRDKEIARIDTPAGQMKLLGTIVDASMVRKDTVAVTVVEGKVQLSNRHGSAVVSAGKRSIMAANRSPLPGVGVNAYRETAWYHGKGDYQSDYGDVAYAVNRIPGLLSEVWIMKADGSGNRRLQSFVGSLSELGPWLPGERWLALKLSTLLWSTPDRQTRAANSGAGHPIVNGRIILVDAATGNSMELPIPDGYDPWYVSYAPNSQLVAFTGVYRDPENTRNWEAGVWLFDTHSGKVSSIESGNLKTAPVWAPDSRHIAISSGANYTNDHKLIIIDTKTGQTRDLGVNGAGACFSPDGTKIAYSSDFKRDGSWYAGVPTSGSIFVLDLSSGSAPVRVSPRHENATRPRWSPDGTRILYIDSDNRLCVVNADGANPKQIYTGESDIQRASWAPSGDAVYVTLWGTKESGPQVLLISGDGSRIKPLFYANKKGVLPPNVKAQTEAAASAIKEGIFQYAMGQIYSLEGSLPARRQSYSACADIFSGLVWNYPLAGFNTYDVLRYADVAAKEAARPDAEVLQQTCKQRVEWYLDMAVAMAAAKHHRFPPDLTTALEWTVDSGWQVSWLHSSDKTHIMMLGSCPGDTILGETPYIYNAPQEGSEPMIGDVIIQCPVHPDNCFIWNEHSSQRINKLLMSEGKPGAWCKIEGGFPYRFENAGSGTLTIIRHSLKNSYEVRGTVKVLPTGQIYTDEEFSLDLTDEGSVAQAIDSARILDWGGLPEDEARRAQQELDFCRAVAQFEAGISVADMEFLNRGNLYKAIEGEPARLAFCGDARGSCGASGSNLRFDLIGPGRIELYQLKPSGRFRVFGTVKVMQTGQTCKNGWIDKNGNVISSEH